MTHTIENVLRQTFATDCLHYPNRKAMLKAMKHICYHQFDIVVTQVMKLLTTTLHVAALLQALINFAEASYGQCGDLIVKWEEKWSGGLDAWVMVKEKESPAITEWSATIEFDREVSNCVDWNAVMTKISAKKYKAVGASWNSNVPHGTQLLAKFRVTYTWGTTPPKPVSLNVNGKNYKCSGSPAATTTTAFPETTTTKASTINQGTDGCEDLKIKITELWNGGIWIEIMVKEIGEAAINSWSLTIKFDRDVLACNDWNAIMTKISADTYKAVGAAWNSHASKNEQKLAKFQVTYPWGTPAPNIVSIAIEGKGTYTCSGSTTVTTTTQDVPSSTAATPPEPTKSTETTTTPLQTTSQQSTSSQGPSGGCSKKVVCYYPSWAYYRTGKELTKQ